MIFLPKTEVIIAMLYLPFIRNKLYDRPFPFILFNHITRNLPLIAFSDQNTLCITSAHMGCLWTPVPHGKSMNHNDRLSWQQFISPLPRVFMAFSGAGS
jgi:hypothetical protein